MTDWTIIRRSLTSRMFSTVTTVITVAVAVAMMLVLLSMRDAGERAFSRGGGNMHLLVSADTDPLSGVLNGVFYARPPRRPIEWAKFLELSSWIPWRDAEQSGRFDDGFFIPVQQGDSFRGFPVLATTEAFFARFQPAPGSAWAFMDGGPFKGDFEVVLGSTPARATGLKVGDEIVLTHGTPDATTAGSAHEHDLFKFKVVGVLKPTGASHDHALFTSIQSAWILHAHDRLEREHAVEGEHDHGHEEAKTSAADLTDADRKITGIYLRLVTAKGSNTSAALPQVFDRLRKDSGVTVAQPKQEIDKLFSIVGNINQILVAMAGVVMVSSGIAIMLALYNSMEQRRRQIAVLRVLGCSRPRIVGLVLAESGMLGVLGAVVGIAVAVAGGWIVAWVMKERLGLVIDPSLSRVWVLCVAAATVGLSAAAGIVPAVMAYRTSVAKNLRPLG